MRKKTRRENKNEASDERLSLDDLKVMYIWNG
jgi:hypothetical protein